MGSDIPQKGEDSMNRQGHDLLNITLLSLFFILASGCTLKASTESVTDATTNFLSSTTPGAWFTVDGLLKPSERLNAFVATNYKNLQQEMAQGGGEYLTALSRLLDIPESKIPSFYALAQEKYEEIQVAVERRPQAIFTNLSDMQLRLQTD